MGAPHNTKRYGETWDSAELAAMQQEIEAVQDLVIVSGGWAWHFLSPPHPELRHAHDHKDADLFAAPDEVWELMTRLTERGYQKTWTRFDDQSQDFHRYVKTIEQGADTASAVKIIFDVFTQAVPFVMTDAGVRVVEPGFLLSLYGVKHGSGACFSVQIAKALLAQGNNPLGRAEMADFGPFLSQS